MRFSLGGTEQTAVTGANGVATVELPLLFTPGTYTLTAAFDGTITHRASESSQPLVVTKLGTNLTLTSPGGDGRRRR